MRIVELGRERERELISSDGPYSSYQLVKIQLPSLDATPR